MTRNNSIDNIRLLAIFGVVILHSFPFALVDNMRPLAIAINQLTRFAVPCFFVLSGFLYAQRVWSNGASASLRKSAPRIIFLYFFWCVFYVLPYNVSLIIGATAKAPFSNAVFNFLMWVATPENFLLGGSKAHLWFLSALFCATVVCTPFIAHRRIWPMLVVSFGLYIVGLLADPYRDSFPGVSLPINVRNGPIFSSLLFALGASLAAVKNTRLFFRTGCILTLVGVAGQLTEITFLMQHGYQRHPHLLLLPDYLFSTIALGTGPAMIGLSGVAASNNKPWLGGIGRYTLGIYALHYFVMDLFIPVRDIFNTTIWWQFVGPPLYFTLTALIVASLARVPRLRPLIS